MRIFITGANGQLAKTIAQLYPHKDIYFGTKEELNIVNKNQVLKQIEKFKPNVIFHFASMTRGDECARHPEKAFDINVNGTRNVVSACANTNALLVFVSTNEVFDGKKQRPYVEGDKPSPITVVGRTKYEAEKIIQKTIEKHFIIRTSWLYSKWNSNFIHAVLKKVRKDKEIELVKDEISTPTYSVDLSIGIKKLIKTKKYGTYHLSNIGYASRMEFAKKAFDILNLKEIKINPIRLSKYERLSKPPLFTPLKNNKARRLGIVLPVWDKSLERFIKENLANYNE